MIDDCPPGHLAPTQLAERTWLGARLADRDSAAADYIAGHSRCQALLDRAGLTLAELRIGGPIVTAPGPEESAPTRDR